MQSLPACSALLVAHACLVGGSNPSEPAAPAEQLSQMVIIVLLSSCLLLVLVPLLLMCAWFTDFINQFLHKDRRQEETVIAPPNLPVAVEYTTASSLSTAQSVVPYESFNDRAEPLPVANSGGGQSVVIGVDNDAVAAATVPTAIVHPISSHSSTPPQPVPTKPPQHPLEPDDKPPQQWVQFDETANAAPAVVPPLPPAANRPAPDTTRIVFDQNAAGADDDPFDEFNAFQKERAATQQQQQPVQPLILSEQRISIEDAPSPSAAGGFNRSDQSSPSPSIDTVKVSPGKLGLDQAQADTTTPAPAPRRSRQHQSPEQSPPSAAAAVELNTLAEVPLNDRAPDETVITMPPSALVNSELEHEEIVTGRTRGPESYNIEPEPDAQPSSETSKADNALTRTPDETVITMPPSALANSELDDVEIATGRTRGPESYNIEPEAQPDVSLSEITARAPSMEAVSDDIYQLDSVNLNAQQESILKDKPLPNSELDHVEIVTGRTRGPESYIEEPDTDAQPTVSPSEAHQTASVTSIEDNALTRAPYHETQSDLPNSELDHVEIVTGRTRGPESYIEEPDTDAQPTVSPSEAHQTASVTSIEDNALTRAPYHETQSDLPNSELDHVEIVTGRTRGPESYIEEPDTDAQPTVSPSEAHQTASVTSIEDNALTRAPYHETQSDLPNSELDHVEIVTGRTRGPESYIEEPDTDAQPTVSPSEAHQTASVTSIEDNALTRAPYHETQSDLPNSELDHVEIVTGRTRGPESYIEEPDTDAQPTVSPSEDHQAASVTSIEDNALTRAPYHETQSDLPNSELDHVEIVTGRTRGPESYIEESEPQQPTSFTSNTDINEPNIEANVALTESAQNDVTLDEHFARAPDAAVTSELPNSELEHVEIVTGRTRGPEPLLETVSYDVSEPADGTSPNVSLVVSTDELSNGLEQQPEKRNPFMATATAPQQLSPVSGDIQQPDSENASNSSRRGSACSSLSAEMQAIKDMDDILEQADPNTSELSAMHNPGNEDRDDEEAQSSSRPHSPQQHTAKSKASLRIDTTALAAADTALGTQQAVAMQDLAPEPAAGTPADRRKYEADRQQLLGMTTRQLQAIPEHERDNRIYKYLSPDEIWSVQERLNELAVRLPAPLTLDQETIASITASTPANEQGNVSEHESRRAYILSVPIDELCSMPLIELETYFKHLTADEILELQRRIDTTMSERRSQKKQTEDIDPAALDDEKRPDMWSAAANHQSQMPAGDSGHSQQLPLSGHASLSKCYSVRQKADGLSTIVRRRKAVRSQLSNVSQSFLTSLSSHPAAAGVDSSGFMSDTEELRMASEQPMDPLQAREFILDAGDEVLLLIEPSTLQSEFRPFLTPDEWADLQLRLELAASAMRAHLISATPEQLQQMSPSVFGTFVDRFLNADEAADARRRLTLELQPESHVSQPAVQAEPQPITDAAPTAAGQADAQPGSHHLKQQQTQSLDQAQLDDMSYLSTLKRNQQYRLMPSMSMVSDSETESSAPSAQYLPSASFDVSAFETLTEHHTSPVSQADAFGQLWPQQPQDEPASPHPSPAKASPTGNDTSPTLTADELKSGLLGLISGAHEFSSVVHEQQQQIEGSGPEAAKADQVDSGASLLDLDLTPPPAAASDTDKQQQPATNETPINLMD